MTRQTDADDRCASIATDDGHVLYDPENPQAWIQTDATVDAAEVR